MGGVAYEERSAYLHKRRYADFHFFPLLLDFGYNITIEIKEVSL